MPGNDAGHPPTDATDLPADAFALVGNPLRAEIVWILGHTGNFELSFGDLRARLDTDVEPSQLHYHLQQLVGHFVGKTDSGYRLNAAGLRLCLTLRAGTFDRQQEKNPIDTDVDCYYCQGPVEVTFVDDFNVAIVCSECEHVYGGSFLDIPLWGFEDGAASFSFAHFRKYMALKTLFVSRGVCPSCAHPLSPTFYPPEYHPDPLKVDIHQSCDLCGLVWEVTVGRALLADPELRTFCHDHGVDPVTTPWWELEFAATDEHATVRSTDPWEVALEVTFDGDTLELVVDGDLNVIERNRRTATGTTEVILPDKESCLQALRRHRWPDGVRCPHCNGGDTTKKGTTGKDTQRYRCANCESIFNDLTGTVFAERHLSLPEMFYIVRETNEPDTAWIARQLDRSHGPVSDFTNNVRKARDEDGQVDLSAIGRADEIHRTSGENGRP